jgi:beta-glucanase (GH16 family)
MKLYAKPTNFTSGRVRSKAVGFSHGAFVFRAKLPRGNHLLPTISLLPAYQDHDNCKYEEIDIVQARGQKTSNLIFSAQYGRRWNIVAVKKKERAFPGVDFSEDFHEFAVVWKPLRIDWYVDDTLVYTASTHFYSDWRLPDDSNLPCSKNKGLFKQTFQLNLGLSIGGSMFPEKQYGVLALDESKDWPKPTFEIDWVKVFQY